MKTLTTLSTLSNRKKMLFHCACCRLFPDLPENIRQILPSIEDNPVIMPDPPIWFMFIWNGNSPRNWGYSVSMACLDRLEEAIEVQTEILNDFTGNADVPRTQTVIQIARAAYEERINGELSTTILAVLADALEEAGCTDEAVLAHLREPGRHWRGCWVVDACLGLS